MSEKSDVLIEDIIKLTPDAVNEAKRLLGLEKDNYSFIRLGVVSGGCSGMSYTMGFESDKNPFDREFDYDGLKVLVDLKVMRYLTGTVLDFENSLMGGGFKFNNPKAAKSCGCGSSFSC